MVFCLANEPKQAEKSAQFARTGSRPLIRSSFLVLNLKKLLNGFRSGSSERVNLGPRKRIPNNSVIIHILILLNQSDNYTKRTGEPWQLIDLMGKILHARSLHVSVSDLFAMTGVCQKAFRNVGKKAASV